MNTTYEEFLACLKRYEVGSVIRIYTYDLENYSRAAADRYIGISSDRGKMYFTVLKKPEEWEIMCRAYFG